MNDNELDNVVGVVLEFAEAYHINNDIIRDMNDKYDTGEPSKEEKIQFLRDVLPLLPSNSNLVDLIKKTLADIDSGVEKATITKVNGFLLKNGGLITTYEIDNEMLGKFFVVTYDDNSTEFIWGCGITEEDAIKTAMHEWDKYVKHDNPFTFALMHVQS